MGSAAVDLGGKFRFIKMLGKGVSGEVYLAKNQELGRTEAIKVLAPTTEDQTFAARFAREAQATLRLDHPNIVRVYECGELPDGRPYMALEYIPGETLAETLAREGRLSSRRTLRIVDQLARAVSHAHERGVIHRDLKPQNVILNGDDELKVLDFGLAKIIAPDHHEPVELTGAGDVFGSPVYMAPEQFLGQPPDPRTDVYAIGCIAYEALVGSPPFGGTLIELMQGHTGGDVIAPGDLSQESEISADFDQLVLRCMAKSAAHRYASGADLSRALEQLPDYGALLQVEGSGPSLSAAVAADPHAVQGARRASWNLAAALIEHQRATSHIVSSVQQLHALAQQSAAHTSLRHAIHSLTQERSTASPDQCFDLDMQIATMNGRLDDITRSLDADYHGAYRSLRDALDDAIEGRTASRFGEAVNAYQAARHLL